MKFFFLIAFLTLSLKAVCQDLLPNSLLINIEPTKTDDVRWKKMALYLNKTTERVVDSLRKDFKYVQLSFSDSLQVNAGLPYLISQSKLVENDGIYPIPLNRLGQFEYITQRYLLSGNKMVLFHKIDDIYKDLPGIVQEDNHAELFSSIYKTLKKQINVFSINTKTLLQPINTNQRISIHYNGINSDSLEEKKEFLILNGLVNNMLINGQSQFKFNYYPEFITYKPLKEYLKDDLYIHLDLKKEGANYKINLIFDGKNPIKQSQNERFSLNKAGNLTTDFSIPIQKIEHGDYSDLIFEINKSLYKFLLFNLN